MWVRSCRATSFLLVNRPWAHGARVGLPTGVGSLVRRNGALRTKPSWAHRASVRLLVGVNPLMPGCCTLVADVLGAEWAMEWGVVAMDPLFVLRQLAGTPEPLLAVPADVGPPARMLPRSGQPRWTAHRMRWSRRCHRAARRPTFAKRVSSPGGRFHSEHSDNGIFGGHGNGGIARPPLRLRSPWLGPRSLPRVLPRRRIILGFHRDVAMASRRESTSKSGVKAVAALNDCLFQIPTSTSGGPPIANLSLPQPNRSRHPERALASSR